MICIYQNLLNFLLISFNKPTSASPFLFFLFFLPGAQSQTDILLGCTSRKYSCSNTVWLLLFNSSMYNRENSYQNWDF